MSGIGQSLADLDKTVNKSIPGGWVTLGGLALGGAGAMGAFGGAGGAAGSAGSAAGGTASATGAGTAAGTAAAMESAAIASAAAQGTLTEGMIAAANTGLPMGATIPTGYAGLSSSMAAELGLSGASGLGTQGASGNVLANVYGASNPFKISPTQAMAMNRAMGGFGPQTGGTNTQVAPFKRGEAVNVADPIASLLAPKRKRERQMISLL